MSSGVGIQELMKAETRASQIVAEARMGMYLIKLLRKELYIENLIVHICERNSFFRDKISRFFLFSYYIFNFYSTWGPNETSKG